MIRQGDSSRGSVMTIHQDGGARARGMVKIRRRRQATCSSQGGGRHEGSSRDFVKSIHTDISSAGFVKRLRQESSSRELANRIRQESSCVGAPKISPKCSKHKFLVVGASPWNVREKSYNNSDIGIGGRPWQVVFPPLRWISVGMGEELWCRGTSASMISDPLGIGGVIPAPESD